MARPAWAYARVSTREQYDDGLSVDAQIAKASAWCELRDLEYRGVETDGGISGKRADNRPALQAALDKVCAEGGVLVVYSLSRLARSVRDAIAICDRLRKSNADLVILDMNVDTTHYMGRFIFTLMAALAELESEQIGERVRMVRQYQRDRAMAGNGEAPFGFDLFDGLLVPNEPEVEAWNLIDRWRRQGRSYRSICKALDRRKIKPKRGGKWQPSSVRCVWLRFQEYDLEAARRNATLVGS